MTLQFWPITSFLCGSCLCFDPWPLFYGQITANYRFTATSNDFRDKKFQWWAKSGRVWVCTSTCHERNEIEIILNHFLSQELAQKHRVDISHNARPVQPKSTFQFFPPLRNEVVFLELLSWKGWRNGRAVEGAVIASKMEHWKPNYLHDWSLK